MVAGVVTHLTVEAFQKQHGTLRAATEKYLDGLMNDAQAQAFERVVEPGFIFAVAQTRLLRELLESLRTGPCR